MTPYEIVGYGSVSLYCVNASIQPSYTDDTVSFINSAWQLGLERSDGKLFEGTMLNYLDSSTEKDQLTVEANSVSYKYFWVQKTTGLDLRVHPVGVSGLLMLTDDMGDAIVFARRTKVNLQYPGHYELIPSGGIETKTVGKVDYYESLLTELYEEVGVTKNQVDGISSLGLIFDTMDNVYDVACLIRIRMSRNEMRQLIANSGEYEDVTFVDLETITSFLDSHKHEVVPVSFGILQMFNKTRTNEYN